MRPGRGIPVEFQTRCWVRKVALVVRPPIVKLLCDDLSREREKKRNPRARRTRQTPIRAGSSSIANDLGRKDTKELEASVVDSGLALQLADDVVRALRDALVNLRNSTRRAREGAVSSRT